MSKITLGTFEETPIYTAAPRVLSESPGLNQHLGEPWLLAHLQQEFDLELPTQITPPVGSTAEWDEHLGKTHLFISGASGSGKTKALSVILRQYMERQQDSILLFDPKIETINQYVRLARQTGFAPLSVTVLSPRLSAQPGWNPFLCGGGVQAATDFANTVEALTPSSAPRAMNILSNLALIGIGHRLSIYECLRFLQRDDFRQRLFAGRPPEHLSKDDEFAYQEARDYFRLDFSFWSPGEKATATQPLITRLQEPLRNRFLASILLARTNTLHLEQLWTSKRPGVVLVHVDESTIGRTGTRLLTALLVQALYRAALRHSGHRSCLLVLDELALAEGYFRDTICQILAIGRSAGIHLLAATQYARQLSEPLQNSLAQASISIRFRHGSADVGVSAQALTTDTPRPVTKVWIGEKPTKSGTRPQYVEVTHILRTPTGTPVGLDGDEWSALENELIFCRDQVFELETSARLLGWGDYLTVRNPVTKQLIPIARYTIGLGRREMFVRGPYPLRLVIRIAAYTVKRSETPSTSDIQTAWSTLLMNLPTQRCVLKLPGSPPRIARVQDVEPSMFTDKDQHYLHAALHANCIRTDEIDRTLEWRRNFVDPDVPTSSHRSREEAHDDDSID